MLSYQFCVISLSLCKNIYGHTWPVHWGEEDEQKEILVYSNQPEVELFVNGLSAGKKRRNLQDYPAQGLHWKVKLQKGSNTVKAVAGTLSDEITFEYQTESLPRYDLPVYLMT